MLNKEQLLEIIEDNDLHDELQAGGPRVINGITFTHIKEHGGHEGAGEEYWIVFSAKEKGVEKFYKVPGFYASHYGSELEWSNLFEVEAVEVKVTEWQEVK